MNQQLLHYMAYAREHHIADADIRANLIGAGWQAAQVDAALASEDDLLLVAPPPPYEPTSDASNSNAKTMSSGPIAVVQQRTTRGLEYTIMFLSLGISAVSLGQLLHSLLDAATGVTTDNLSSFATSALVVALPVFVILFLRLKRAELKTPEIRLDPSRRHAVQLALVVSFLWGVFRLATYVYSLLGGGEGDYLGSNNPSPIANLLHLVITIGIAGTIFAYYWVDEHRKEQA